MLGALQNFLLITLSDHLVQQCGKNHNFEGSIQTMFACDVEVEDESFCIAFVA